MIWYSKNQQRLNLKDFLKEYALTDFSNKLDELIRAGMDFTNYTSDLVLSADGSDKKTKEVHSYFHHDVRKMYLLWKEEAIQLFKLHNEFKDQYEVFCEADSIPGIFIEEKPDFPNPEGYEWLKVINIQVREKLKVLREARKSILGGISGPIRLQGLKCSFDEKRATLIVGKSEIKLPPEKNEYYLVRESFRGFKRGEPMSWDIVAEEITGQEFEVLEQVSSQRKVQDAYYAVNNRVKKGLNTEDNLFSWKSKCIIRNL